MTLYRSLFIAFLFYHAVMFSGCAQDRMNMTARTQCATIMRDLIHAIDRHFSTEKTTAINISEIIENIDSFEDGLLKRNHQGQFIDVWGNAIIIHYEKTSDNIRLKITSIGPDRQLGTKDDIILYSVKCMDTGRWILAEGPENLEVMKTSAENLGSSIKGGFR